MSRTRGAPALRRRGRRRAGLWLLAAAFVVLVGMPALEAPAQTGEDGQARRLSGPDRYATAAAIALDHGARERIVYLATGEQFPDALAAAPAAVGERAPVLLTAHSALPEPTAAALDELAPERVVLVGGEAAISEAVADEVAARTDAVVQRHAGRDRFATAAALALEHGAPGRVAYLTTGTAFADALSGGAAAGAAQGVIVLATRDALPAASADALSALELDRVVVLGGASAISDNVAAQAGAAADAPVERHAGANRFATAAAVARAEFDAPAGIWLATGEDFPDALAGAAVAGAVGEPVLLSHRSCLPGVVVDAVAELGAPPRTLLGGEAALHPAVGGLQRCGSAVSVLAEGLEVPWDVAHLADGRVFVTERDSGRLLELDPATGAHREVRRFVVDPAGEGGLLGLTAGPDGERLYAYYSAAAHGDNRVVRFDPDSDNETVIVSGIAHASNHNGGRIAFGPDGHLYIATGDAGDAERAQDREDLAGAILRVTAEGAVPADNPFGNPVWATGFRNSQGLSWDRAGRLFADDFGPGCDDEINLVEPGRDYGWPDPCGETRAGSVPPLVVRRPAEASWSGSALLDGSAIPQWEGDLLVAALRGRRLWRVDVAGDEASAAELFVGDFGRLRHVHQAPDGAAWLLTSNRDGRGEPIAADDRIVRIGP